MPLIDLPEPNLATPFEGVKTANEDAQAEASSPTNSQIWGAAFRQNNMIGSGAANVEFGMQTDQGQGPYIDPNWDTWKALQGSPYADRWNDFQHIYNKQDFEARKAQVDMEDADRKTMAQSGFMGTLAGITAGTLDLSSLVPVAGQFGKARSAVNVGKAFLLGGTSVAAGVALQEGALQTTQATRTKEETGIALGASFLLGGILGAGIHILAPGERQAAEAAIDRLRNDPLASAPAMPQSAGAAATQNLTRGDLSVDGALANQIVDKTSWLNPNLRLNTSASTQSRLIGQQLAENTLYQVAHSEGQSVGAAVETLMKEVLHGRLADATQGMNDIWSNARKANVGMTRQEFNEAVGMAMRRGDQGENPFVSQAAKVWREKVVEPFKREAIENGQLPADVDVSTADSYFTRLWNPTRLNAEEGRFKKIVQDFYSGSLAREFAADVERLQGRVGKLDQETADLRLDPAMRDKAIQDVEAQQQKLYGNNPDHVDLADQLSDLRQQVAAANRRGDRQAAAQAREAAQNLRKQAGSTFASFEADRAALNARQRNLNLGYAAMADRRDTILSGLADLEEANKRSMLRLIKKGQKLQEDLRRLDPEKLADRVSQLRDAFATEAAKAERQAERFKAQAGKIEAAQGKVESQPAALSASHILRNFIETQRGVTVEALHARATKFQPQLAEAGNEIARITGATFADPGVKQFATAQEKMVRKGYGDASSLTDLSRGGFTVHSAEQADRVASLLADKFEVLDEGWKTAPTGYVDRKVLVKAPDGTIGEIQIIPEPISQLKFSDTIGKLYTKTRSMGPGAERDALMKEQQEAYSAAIRGGNWSGIFDRSKAPNSPSNLARQSASDITADVSKTSQASTATQGPSGFKTANATSGEIDTAGRQSQSQNFISSTSKKSIDDGRIAGNGEGTNVGAHGADLLDRQAKAERARADRLNSIASRLETAESLDPQAMIDEVQDGVQSLIGEVSNVSLARGEKAQRLQEKLANLDPAKVEARLKAIEDTKTKYRQRHMERWDIERGASGTHLPVGQQDFSEYSGDIANAIFDKLTGRGFDNNVPEGIVAATRGPMKERTFSIPDHLVEDFLHSDVQHVMESYARKMAADVELARKFGSADLKAPIAKIQQEYLGLRQAVQGAASVDEIRAIIGKDPGMAASIFEKLKEPTLENIRGKALAALEKGEKSDINDVQSMRDLLRGTYKRSSMDNIWGRTARGLLAYQYITRLGHVTLANISEIYRPAMVYGLGNYMKEGIAPLLTRAGREARALSKAEAKQAGQIVERVLQHRVMSFAEMGDPYAAGSGIERLLQNGTRWASYLNGLSLWTDSMKAVSSIMSQNRIINLLKDGKDVRTLAYLGMDASTRDRVGQQVAKFAEKRDGVWIANTERWEDPQAVRAYRAALNKDVDSVIVTKSVGDVPLFANTPTGKIITQFKAFMLASHQRVLIKGVQESPTRFISGMVGMTSIGMLATFLRLAGQGKYTGEAEQSNPAWWVGEGLDNTGILAVPMELANDTEKLTGLNPLKDPLRAAGAAAFGGETGQGKSSKINNRGTIGQLLGPAVGTGDDLVSMLKPFATRATGEKASPAQDKAAIDAAIRNVPGYSYLGVRELTDLFVKPWLHEQVGAEP